MKETKRLLIVKASSDICAAEVEHIKTVAEMFGMVHRTYGLKSLATFQAELTGNDRYDYIYLAAHANVDCFGESDGSVRYDWEMFGLRCELGVGALSKNTDAVATAMR